MNEIVRIPGRAPALVFLHEGLGCVAMWRDFPARLCAATGCAGLVYSRKGYGQSDPVALPRPLDYMERDGVAELEEVLGGERDVTLIGHSDGASIAIAYAGTHDGLRGLILEAPHVFTEDMGLRSIAAAREAYEHGNLRRRLLRYHGENVDCAFWGWNRAWLDPGFRAWNLERFLPAIAVPTLVIQGENDEYGTVAQVEAIRKQVARAEVLLLPECGHSPHRDQPERTLFAMADFVRRLL